MRNYLVITVACLVVTAMSCATLRAEPIAASHDMKERVKYTKESVVRIKYLDRQLGTGFVISENGLIATCLHVVTDDTSGTKTLYPSLQVYFNDGTIYDAEYVIKRPNKLAIDTDYAILKIQPKKPLRYLKLGSFKDAADGDAVYISGYPFELLSPIFAGGMLSTKVRLSNPGSDFTYDAAYLDLTLNSGNSGGPVILIGAKREDDLVIGIQQFPLAQ